MPTVDAAGVKLAVATRGLPAPVAAVLINPLGTDYRIWDPLLPHLPPRLATVRYDQRGHGGSGDGSPPYAMADHIADLSALIDALGVPRVVLVGLSIGGMIAIGYAARNPGRVAALALIGSAHKIGTPQVWSDRIDLVGRDGLAAVADLTMERWFSPDFRRDRHGEVARWRDMVRSGRAAGYLGSCAALRDADLADDARAIRAPTLALVGSLDPTVPPETAATTVELIPGARLMRLDGLAHIPTVEAPARVAEPLTSFLRETGLV